MSCLSGAPLVLLEHGVVFELVLIRRALGRVDRGITDDVVFEVGRSLLGEFAHKNGPGL